LHWGSNTCSDYFRIHRDPYGRVCAHSRSVRPAGRRFSHPDEYRTICGVPLISYQRCAAQSNSVQAFPIEKPDRCNQFQQLNAAGAYSQPISLSPASFTWLNFQQEFH